ncbi:MAG: GAF domain-containing protein [Pseudomonadota bacterium]|nr:GAF domain-containing protein [Pseudomonadota bacterium]
MDLSETGLLGWGSSHFRNTAWDATPGSGSRPARDAATPVRILLVRSGPGDMSERLVQQLRRRRFVVNVCHAATVLTTLAESAWDALLIDAQAGAQQSIELTVAVRAVHSSSEVPILILGTQAHWGSSGTALVAGANDWTTQPVDIDELGQRLLNLADLSRLHRSNAAEKDRYRDQLSARSSRLDALIETGIMMSMERDRAKLLNRLLHEGRRLLNCDAGTMYMVSEEKTLGFELRTRSDPLPAMQIPLYDSATGRPNDNYVSVYTAINSRSVLIDDVYAETRFDLSGTRAFDAASGYRTVSMLTVPIAPRGGEAVGVLQFMNAMDPLSGGIVAFDRDSVALVEALAAQAAVALDNLALVESQKQLMESLIRVLATAIDAKSPYTGRHCERVPDLAMRLAQAACDAKDGPLADFCFGSDEEWQEFRIGAWLHDCGKVTTPEYVIDKATKLETLHNRIHEVRMRFEVLQRDLEIERLQAQLRGQWQPQHEAEHQKAQAQLTQDFAFVAKCNIGSEYMSDADAHRLTRIGARRWVRHFDDRLGLSDAELQRWACEAPRPVPCAEPLLSDRPRDILARPDDEQLDPSFGFKMEVPTHLYNRGELHNLSVRKGTLTPEERYKINEHMVHTVMMLERMPFPKHLKRVPEYAGTHHERIDGKGYPRQLGAAELSVPSRIMAVADIFEALTAADRPYKKPKRLSDALRVLQHMAGTHVDPDIFNLFLQSGVYLDYAREHLRPDQIDVSDPTPYLARVA